MEPEYKTPWQRILNVDKRTTHKIVEDPQCPPGKLYFMPDDPSLESFTHPCLTNDAPHHWVTKFIDSRIITSINTCSMCGNVDGKDLDNQISMRIFHMLFTVKGA